jgi:hypothetical protein
MKIIDKQTGEVIGKVITNHSMTLDQAFELAGFDWKTVENDSCDGIECDGWYKDGVLYDESTAEMDYN